MIVAGSRVVTGTYRCASCGYTMDIEVATLLPACPRCGSVQWEGVPGSADVPDRDPDR